MGWQTWGIGSRTQWDVTKTFYLGVEVLYSDLHSAKTGCGTMLANGCGGGNPGAIPVGANTVAFGNAGLLESDSHSWMVSVRAHRDFLP
jgi:hypothetical protein